MIAAAILVIFPLCLAIAAFSDLLTMTIPNRVSVILLASFIVIAPLAGLGLTDVALHLAAGGAVFTFCFALFVLRIMGGGDAKLLTTSALWFGLTPSLMEYLLYVSIFGGILSVVVLLIRSQSNLIATSGMWIPKTLLDTKKVPYGLAIGAAALVAYPSSPLMQIVILAQN